MRGHNTNYYSYKDLGWSEGGGGENPKAVKPAFPFSSDLGRNCPGLEDNKDTDFLVPFP